MGLETDDSLIDVHDLANRMIDELNIAAATHCHGVRHGEGGTWRYTLTREAPAGYPRTWLGLADRFLHWVLFHLAERAGRSRVLSAVAESYAGSMAIMAKWPLLPVFEALDELPQDVASHLGLIGPCGSGKSTLANRIAARRAMMGEKVLFLDDGCSYPLFRWLQLEAKASGVEYIPFSRLPEEERRSVAAARMTELLAEKGAPRTVVVHQGEAFLEIPQAEGWLREAQKAGIRLIINFQRASYVAEHGLVKDNVPVWMLMANPQAHAADLEALGLSAEEIGIVARTHPAVRRHLQHLALMTSGGVRPSRLIDLSSMLAEEPPLPLLSGPDSRGERLRQLEESLQDNAAAFRSFLGDLEGRGMHIGKARP